MTKSRIAIIALAIGCIAMLSAGTAAYFTVQDTAVNVITAGLLDMTLEEKTTDGSLPGTDLEDLPDFPVNPDGTPGVLNVMPGETVSKIPYLANNGTADFYGRIKFASKIVVDGKELSTDVLELDINTADWKLKDGWYYFTKSVKPGEKTTPLFTTVKFAEATNNDYQNATVTIDVYAEAVQSKNNGTSWDTAAGWPTVE